MGLTKTDRISKISEYRNALMGAAILWVMCHHSGFFFPYHVLNRFCELGYAGVDIFMFLSGLGVYVSLNKNPDTASFYKRRIERILPAYLPVLLIWLIANWPQGETAIIPGFVIGNLTGIAYWLNMQYFNWYIVALPTYYFLAPLLCGIVRQGDKKKTCRLLVTLLLIGTCFFYVNQLIMVSRFIVFVFGMIAGRWLCTKKELSRRQEYAAYVIMAAGFILYEAAVIWIPEDVGNIGLFWYPFAAIVPGLCILLTRVFSILAKWKIGKRALSILSYIGKSSFEIYLVHILGFDVLREYTIGNMRWLALFLMMLFIGMAYHVLITRASAFFKDRFHAHGSAA